MVKYIKRAFHVTAAILCGLIVTGCAQGQKAEELMSEVASREYTGCNLAIDASMTLISANPEEAGDFDLNIKAAVDVEADGTNGHIFGNMHIDMLDMQFDQPMESYYMTDKERNKDVTYVYDSSYSYWMKSEMDSVGEESVLNFDFLSSVKDMKVLTENNSYILTGKIAMEDLDAPSQLTDIVGDMGGDDESVFNDDGCKFTMSISKDNKSIEYIKLDMGAAYDEEKLESKGARMKKYEMLYQNVTSEKFDVSVPEDVLEAAVDESEVSSLESLPGASYYTYDDIVE